jgi:IS4 transposase
MLLGKRFEAYVENSPVSVMVHGTLERVFNPEKLDQIFEDNAVIQYTKELTFSQCVYMMCDVVTKVEPSVGAWYKSHAEEMTVTRQAVYDKLKHMELPVSAGLVCYCGGELLDCLRRMKAKPRPLLPGYRARVLDGNHLAGTEHRIFELRRYRAAPLPGQALVLYDPQFDVVTHVIPCEDAYAQERSLLDEVLALVVAGDLMLADRNFCTIGFLFGIKRREAFFAIRQHASLPWKPKGKRRMVGRDAKGRAIYEQTVCLSEPESGETLVARRITIVLDKPTKQGDHEIHILTNLPRKAADAIKVAELYGDRWTIEDAFLQLTVDLKCEIDTLGYPKAALFGFCLALVAYNIVSLVKGAIRAVWGQDYVEEQLSMYYLTLEVTQVTKGMLISVPPKHWGVFRTMTTQQFANTMVDLARHMKTHKYTKSKRGPKKKPSPKISGKHNHHISTARILSART